MKKVKMWAYMNMTEDKIQAEVMVPDEFGEEEILSMLNSFVSDNITSDYIVIREGEPGWS